ncbi:hypothetical protein EJ06DRAFT_404984 [Trichodelitschia bisporula]|uniref:Uncharacterized protein n=1 Tax=Trichodelitschia bisporula TaxID=703511 RepID=A0A6G1HXK7_9PEZI|nr:hypothetical protein EJ06DRAFT_404984 [Trichodelitschia bisporula]
MPHIERLGTEAPLFSLYRCTLRLPVVCHISLGSATKSSIDTLSKPLPLQVPTRARRQFAARLAQRQAAAAAAEAAAQERVAETKGGETGGAISAVMSEVDIQDVDESLRGMGVGDYEGEPDGLSSDESFDGDDADVGLVMKKVKSGGSAGSSG